MEQFFDETDRNRRIDDQEMAALTRCSAPASPVPQLQPLTQVAWEAPFQGATYLCPGEQHSISRSVHLARLAAHFPPCATCEHRSDQGELPPGEPPIPVERNRMRGLPLLEMETGFRGTYLNELDRHVAAKLAAAYAKILWEVSRSSIQTASPDPESSGLVMPTVLVGQDERPHSADLLVGVTRALMRMACRVIHVGEVTLPCFRAASRQLQTSGGVYLTGAGGNPAAAGLDLFGQHGLPCSHTDVIQRVIALCDERVQRPLRRSGGYETVSPQENYDHSLETWFHALRPLRVVVGTPGRHVTRVLTRLFSTVACSLQIVALPIRRRDLSNPLDPDLQKINREVVRSSADLGCVIDEDGESVVFFTEQGKEIPSTALTLLLAASERIEQPGLNVVLNQSAESICRPVIEGGGSSVSIVGDTLCDIARGVQESAVLLGGGTGFRHWHGNDSCSCDALLTLARVLRALSRSDARCSEALERAMTIGR